MSLVTAQIYASWFPIKEPILAGHLLFQETSRGGVFSFEYDRNFLKSPFRMQLDPSLALTSGEHYNDKSDKNFCVFLDSCPDRWGELLMKRRAALDFKNGHRTTARITAMDYLLGVHDSYRMGGLRFKTAPEGNFLDDNAEYAASPMASLKQLEYASMMIENDENIDSDEYYRWLSMLIAPGSSLGGARPKACVQDDNNDLWIAKFPSSNDITDVGAWEMVCHKLALGADIDMYPCDIRKFNSTHHTFITKRFDRDKGQRIHFSSAMTQLQYYDGRDETEDASYLELAEFLTVNGSQTQKDLAQLWRRIVFNIAVSNTDDHLRNHGFLLTKKGWALSPAYDLNPSIDKTGLHLNIDDMSNELDYDLAFSVADYFNLKESEAKKIYDDVMLSVKNWEVIASGIGISRQEQLGMQEAFRV